MAHIHDHYKETKEGIDHYLLELNQKMAALRSDLSPLRGEYLQKLLCKDMYQDLVLLEREQHGTRQEGIKRVANKKALENWRSED